MSEAVEQGADCVLITSAVQSNFMRTAAAASRQLGNGNGWPDLRPGQPP